MIAHAQAEFPIECCGALAGTIGTDGIARIERRYPFVNALGSPTAYLWEPKDVLDAARDMRARDIEIVAIYHSHPSTDPIPSHTDRDQYAEVRPFLGEVMHFIIGLREAAPVTRAWWLDGDERREAEWELV